MNQIVLMGIMVFAAFLGASGQIFLKRASDILELSIQSIVSNWWLYGFVICYGAAVVLQLIAYKAGGRVSIIYPVISLSYAFSAFLAWKFLGEAVSIYSVIGIVIILAGVSLIGYGASIGS